MLADAIDTYAGMGWSLMLLDKGKKKTDEVDWPDGPDDPELLKSWVPAGGANLAVRLGARSGNLADVDLDDPGAVLLAPELLPRSGARFGRSGRTLHYFYLAPDGPPPGGKGTTRLQGERQTASGSVPHTYAELRWNGGYTVLPPSTHPDGDTYKWATGPLVLPAVAWATLDAAVREVAAGAVLLEAYSDWHRLRSRHYATLALSAALLRAGWALPRVERFVYALAQAGGDEEAEARVTNARSTAEAFARGEAALPGWSALVSFCGDDRIKRFKRFLGIDAYDTSAWAGVVSGAGSGGNAAPQQAPARTTTPATAPAPTKQGSGQVGGTGAPGAPVFATAQAAAQQAAQQTKQAKLSANEVALAVAVALHTAVPLARDEGQQLYHYAGGVYHSKDTELYLRQHIQREVLTYGAEYLHKGIEDEVLHRLLVGTPPLEERPDPRYLNLENGRLDVTTLELKPHDPAVRTTLMLPIAYDPTATCPQIERFCAQVFPPDAMAAGVPWELIALCACPVEGIDKAILLLGEGENGKGIYLELVQRFVGKANTSAVSLQRIGDDRFATADLRGRLLNLCADLPSRRLEDSGDFKIIVSQETIRAQRKNQQAFDFRPFCRLLFSANNAPESADRSRGYIRRWHIVPFTQTFEPGNPLRRPRPEIMRELLTPAELSGLLNRALPFMAGFLAGMEPTETPSMAEAIIEFVESVDDFGMWLEGELVPNITGFVATSQITTRWRNRQERRRMPGNVSWRAIAAAMKARFPKAVADQQRTGGTGSGANPATGTVQGPAKRGYTGVLWRNP